VQLGGTGVAVFNWLAHHAQKAGDNPSGLGHWSWIQLKGKGAQITWAIVVYCPCFSDGPLSTYQQHCQGLMWTNWSDCPWKAILTDLQIEILAWQEAGNSIILLMDFNEDVRLPWIWQFFANVQLIKALTEITGPMVTATHNHGQAPINGIFVTPELLSMLKGSYLTFDTGILSNHWALWINLPSIALGFNDYILRKHLQCKDPWVVATYLNSLLLQLTQANTFHQIEQLLPAMTQQQLMQEQQPEYKSINQAVMSTHIQTEWQCQKLKMGKIPWSPDLTWAINHVLYWKGVISQVKGHQVGTSILCTCTRKGGFQHNLMTIHLPMESLQDELAKAYHRYHH